MIVIPAKAGIQFFQVVRNSLDSGFHRSDDFLRDYHHCTMVNDQRYSGFFRRLSIFP